MKGKHRIVVKNNRLHYEFEIKRNITIIQGDSATGKTTLINMLRQAENLGESSGIDLISDVPCRILEGNNWKIILENSSGNIFFIDEENSFINTEEFASMVKESDNYFVLITRENLYNLPYSVDEIYGLHESGKYHDTRKVYQQMYHIYSIEEKFVLLPMELRLVQK
jgi:predicted ATPase